MESIVINDFSGGVVENVSPTDFSPRQWAELKGFVPESDAVMQSQWPLQVMGSPLRLVDGNYLNNNINFQGCQTLATGDGLFLIAIRENGDLFYCKVPGPQEGHAATAAVVWHPIDNGSNAEEKPSSVYKKNFNIRFITPLNFEAYKYVDKANTDGGVTPAYLLGSRVRRNNNDGDVTGLNRVEQMVVVYYTGSGTPGQELKYACFPDVDRELDSGTDDDNVTFSKDSYTLTNYPYTYLDKANTLRPGRGALPNANVGTSWNNAIILGDIYWQREKADKTVNPDVPATKVVQALDSSNTRPFEGSIYFSAGDIDKFDPRARLELSSAGSEIRGLHVLNDTLIAITSYGGETDGIIALRGNPGQLIRYDGGNANPYAVRRDLLRGGVGMPSRSRNTTSGVRGGSCVWPDAGLVVFIDKMGGVYYTNGETVGRLDEYGPCEPSAIGNFDHVGATNKHLFAWRNKRLWCLTLLGVDSGGDNTACWTELVLPPMNVISNVSGTGSSATYTTTTEHGYSVGDLVTVTGVRPIAYNVTATVTSVTSTTFTVSTTATGSYTGSGFVIATRNGRSVENPVITEEDLRTITGGREEAYFVWKGVVWRYATEGPESERGRANNVPVTLTVSTRTVAVDGSVSDPLWHRFGMTFETSTTCTVDTVRIQSVGAKKRNLVSSLIANNKVGHTTWNLNRTFLNENEGEFIVPAGIGAQSEASATVTFTGNVVLETATFWVSGARPNRGEVPG